ncbi:MAG: branched-chain amino acid ABC transporter permease [Pseudomonadota bacterium]
MSSLTDSPAALSTLQPLVLLRRLLLVALLIIYPFIADPFWIVQIGAQALFLGLIALSLMVLAGLGGMVSLAQLTIAGVAGYMWAIFGESTTPISLHWPWWTVLPLSLLIATLAATFIGAISVRTEGIYTIMITLAIGVGFANFAQQNYEVFNGFNGFAGLSPPQLFGVDWREPVPFYYLALGVAALAYLGVVYFQRSTFGLTLQAIRDNPRRMEALGFHVALHRILAYALAGFLAALGGIFIVWFNGRISPGSIGLGPMIDILVIAVLGGLRHPIGPFIGALVFVLLDNFAIDLIDRERFNTVIGAAFLLVVLLSPDGLLGLWDKLKARLVKNREESGDGG